MVDQIKTYTTEDDFLFSDWNAEMANIYAALNGSLTTTIPNGSVTEIKLADGANPAVYFAELFNDSAVVDGFTFVSKSSLDVTITGGTAYVLKTSTTPNKLIRVIIASNQTFTVTDNATNHLDIGADGVIDVVQTSSPAEDHSRLLEVIALAGVISGTPSDEADRTFLGNFGQLGDIFSMRGEITLVTTAKFDSGLIVRDSTNSFNITLTSDISVNIANPVGLSGLDQGSEASSTWYAGLVVAASGGGLAVATLLVAEANYPDSIVLPSGYDIFRRVMWLRNNSGSDFELGLQIGDHFSYADDIVLVSSLSSSNFADQATSTATPPGAGFVHLSADTGDLGGSSDQKNIEYGGLQSTGSSGGVKWMHARAGSESFDSGRQAGKVEGVPIDKTASRNCKLKTGGSIATVNAVGYIDRLND